MNTICKFFFLAVTILAMISCEESKSPPDQPVNLRTEYLRNPIGLDNPFPAFSWEVNDQTRGAAQSAYRILVASSLEKLDSNEGDIWDSGKITSDQSHLVGWQGSELTSRQVCYWKVMTYDQVGQPSVYSQPASFEMGLLERSDWKAKWIGIDETGKPPRSVMFRKEFTAGNEVKKARIYITGLGTYLLYVNGNKVGDDLLAPGWTDYRKKVQYQVYDVTDFVITGENAIGVVLGNMWWSSGLGWQGGVAYSQGPLRFIAQLEIETGDGKAEVFSDESWKGSHSPYVENTIYDGVTFDARLVQKGWDLPGFDDSKWRSVADLDMSGIRMVAQQEPPIRIVSVVEPVSITEPVEGNYVFDFGINMVGYGKLKVQAPRGTRIQLKYAELLHPNGTVAQENLRSAKVIDDYICSGEGMEEFEPHFTYHGFQYVEVSGLPSKPDKETLKALVFNSAVESAGTFSCSKEILNSIQANIWRGQRSNLMSVPTDCPQRDERLGWMGDAQIFGPTSCYNMDMARFYKKWMRDILDSQDEKEGFVYDVNPAIVVGGPSKPAWGDAVIVIPWIVYKFYGDKSIIEENYDGMKRWVEYMHGNSTDNLYTWSNEDSTWFGYGDWVPVERSPSKPISQAYYYYSTKLLAEMAKIIGKSEDGKELSDRLPAIKDAFNKAYYIKDSASYVGGTQTANLIPVAFGLTEEQFTETVMNSVVENVKAHDNHLTTGFLGTPLLLPMLSDFGHHEIAYASAVQTTYPSWGYMVEKGATTIWELWNSDTERPEGMNSRNHFAYGSVGEWYYGYLAGIRPDVNNPGFKRIIIRPMPAGDLISAKASVMTPYGKVLSDWELKDGSFILSVTIPANTTAEIHLPLKEGSKVMEGESEIYSGGKLTRGKEFFKLTSATDSEVVLETVSGNYLFVVR
ncbi:MAG TPA: glycoside hydrolase family 78 protein [Cyclobacteriaceae bacterium]|nr:glycoside hydrolase family 78 protein [Cyclobacteriaceae bacterium]